MSFLILFLVNIITILNHFKMPMFFLISMHLLFLTLRKYFKNHIQTGNNATMDLLYN